MQKVGAEAQKSGGAAALPAPPPPRSLYIKRNDVEDFLKHLHTQQPTISFTMETENDNTIPFLDTLVIKDSEGRLTTSAYKKPTLISTCLMTHTTLNESDELNAVLSSAYTIDRKISSLNHRLPLRKRSI